MLDFDGHKGVQRLVRDLNRVYRETPALWSLDASPDGFRWIDADDAAGNVFSFIRRAPDGSAVACVVNFSGSPHEDYHLGLPFGGSWDEAINTDAYDYAGSGVGNLGLVAAVEEPHHGLPYSARLRVPPLGAVWLRHAGDNVVEMPVTDVAAVEAEAEQILEDAAGGETVDGAPVEALPASASSSLSESE